MVFKLFVGLSAFLVSFFMSHPALSAVKLTNVAVKQSGPTTHVDLTFDKPLQARSIKPAFERNFVQLVLKSTKIDAAKIVPVPSGQVQKVFAYPYDPETARVRLILKGDAEWAQGKVTLWNNTPKLVRIQIKDSAGAAPAVSAVEKEPVKVVSAPAVAQAAPAEEARLLNEVMSNTREIDIHNPESVKAALNPVAPADEAVGRAEAANASIGTKTDPSRHFARMAISLLVILLVFGGAVWLVRRYAGRLKKLPFGKKERLIQVVATHYLGNKKSISLVKVTGEYMVVGVSNEGISLISKLGPEINVDKYLEDRFWNGTFEKHLNTYANDPKVNKAIDFADNDEPRAPKAALKYDGARDLARLSEPAMAADDEAVAATVAKGIADKVELSPVRASIKEKLTKLKPLQ